jgi:hypothetical protein
MTDIRKQIGLDYLQNRASQRQERPPTESVPQGSPLEEAVLANAGRLLEALRRAGPAPAQLYTLLDELQMRIDVALRVVDYLEEKGYVTVVTRDLKGNHTLQLTESGARLLA